MTNIKYNKVLTIYNVYPSFVFKNVYSFKIKIESKM